MRSFHRALLGFNNLEMHFQNIVSLCVYVKNTQPISPNGEFGQMSWRLYFFLFQRKLFVLFSLSFLMYFGLNTNLAYVSKLGEEGLVVQDYLFTSQRESHSLPDRVFFATILLIWSHFELSRIKLPTLTSSILMEIVTHPILVVLVDQFYFYINQPIMLGFLKKLPFALVYLCIFIWF